MNCWAVWTGRDEAAGAITIELKFTAAPLTVRAAVDFKLPDTAVMVTVPGADPVAIPAEVTLAILESDELHWTVPVTSLLVPSDMCAVAVNCCPEPVPMDIELGATCIEETVA